MNYIELLSAVGIGAILVKLLDIIWLQRMIHDNERDRWKRDIKSIIYSKIARDLISQEEWGKSERSPELLALIGEAALLIEDKTLVSRLELFYKNTLISLNKSSGLRQEAENYGDGTLIQKAVEFHHSEHRQLQMEAREILSLLRKDLLC